MVVRRTKKVKKFRGSHTHGWGAKKKHRGQGNRGGRGMAGTGKRADTMKPSIWGERYFGKLGFKKKGVAKEIKPVNLDYFEKNIDRLVSEKLAEKKENVYVIDIQKLGFNKLLGCGRLTRKYRITAPAFSKNAAERIRKAGGEAVELKKIKAKGA